MADDMDIDIDFANDPDMQRFEEEEARAQVRRGNQIDSRIY